MTSNAKPGNRGTTRMAWFAFFTVLAVTLAIKIVYLMTAESTADFEELPLAAVSLLVHSHAPSTIGESRLYGITYITTAISMWLFGIKVWAFKLPALVFFILSCIALFLVSRKVFSDKAWYYQILPVALIAMGPPVVQMWALKNRGGFIETWCFLAVGLWLYDCWRRRNYPLHIVISLGVLLGIAIWAQPMALLYAIPIGGAVLLQSILHKRSSFWRPVAWFVAAIVIGVMPLLALNFLFHMNTFAYLHGGEDSTVIHGMSFLNRAIVIFDQGFPRLIGLKQQWYQAWVLPKPLSLLVYIILLLPLTWACFTTIRNFLADREATVPVICVAVLVLVLAANFGTTWGGFQGEPRRLLLLYVPAAILITVGLARRVAWSVVYLICWFGLSTTSNVDYVSTNFNGFRHPAYRTYYDVVRTLLSYGVDGVYAPIWIGAKITFESYGAVLFHGDSYRPSKYGYPSIGGFDERKAAIFSDAKLKRLFDGDLRVLGIRCKNIEVQEIAIELGCSRRFDIDRLDVIADQVRRFSAAGVIFDSSGYSSGSFPSLYGRESAYTWSEPDATIPFFLDKPLQNVSLVMRLAKARPLSISTLFISMDGKPLRPVDLAVDNGQYVVRFAGLSVTAGSHLLRISAPPLQPALAGSHDPRSLGVPIVEVRFAGDH